MTQKDKELLLKDLCARLPYNVVVRIDYGDIPYGPVVLKRLDIEKKTAIFNFDVPIEHCKPYLRPISSMTEEEMDILFDILQVDKDGKDEDWIKINDVYGIKFFFPTGKWIEDVADAYDYLYSIHIDFRGLIPMGLAIEVTKENNPYK